MAPTWASTDWLAVAPALGRDSGENTSKWRGKSAAAAEEGDFELEGVGGSNRSPPTIGLKGVDSPFGKAAACWGGRETQQARARRGVIEEIEKIERKGVAKVAARP